MERSDAEVESDLMNLERAVLGTRQATVFIGGAGTVICLLLVLGLLYQVATTSGQAIPSLTFGLFGLLIYLPPALLLLGSGISGYQARQDPVHILMQARLLSWFWYLSMIYIVGFCGLQLFSLFILMSISM